MFLTYKQDVALNNLQRWICHETQENKTYNSVKTNELYPVENVSYKLFTCKSYMLNIHKYKEELSFKALLGLICNLS